MGVANDYTCYHQLCRLVPVLFTPVQQFYLFFNPTCPCTFFTTIQLLYLLIFENFYMLLGPYIDILHASIMLMLMLVNACLVIACCMLTYCMLAYCMFALIYCMFALTYRMLAYCIDIWHVGLYTLLDDILCMYVGIHMSSVGMA